MPAVSVVIRCFNEERHIGRLLDGILEQTVRDVEIIAVDSGSSDRTLEILQRYPVRVLLVSPREFSFGRSLNVGCRAATGEVIVLVSAHAYPVYDDWLAQMLVPFEDPHVALVYGRQRGDEGTKYSEQQIFASWFPLRSQAAQSHPFCNNANAAIRKAVWDRVPYDEDLTGLEDVDWARQAQALGYRVTYAAEAEVVHVHRETWRQIFLRYRREAIAFRHLFPHEHFHAWNFLSLWLRNVASDYYHAARDRVMWTHLVSIPAFRLMQFWGTYRGFAHRGTIPTELKQTFYYPLGRARDRGLTGVRNGRTIDYEQIGRKDTAG